MRHDYHPGRFAYLATVEPDLAQIALEAEILFVGGHAKSAISAVGTLCEFIAQRVAGHWQVTIDPEYNQKKMLARLYRRGLPIEIWRALDFIRKKSNSAKHRWFGSDRVGLEVLNRAQKVVQWYCTGETALASGQPPVAERTVSSSTNPVVGGRASQAERERSQTPPDPIRVVAVATTIVNSQALASVVSPPTPPATETKPLHVVMGLLIWIALGWGVVHWLRKPAQPHNEQPPNEEYLRAKNPEEAPGSPAVFPDGRCQSAAWKEVEEAVLTYCSKNPLDQCESLRVLFMNCRIGSNSDPTPIDFSGERDGLLEYVVPEFGLTLRFQRLSTLGAPRTQWRVADLLGVGGSLLAESIADADSTGRDMEASSWIPNLPPLVGVGDTALGVIVVPGPARIEVDGHDLGEETFVRTSVNAGTHTFRAVWADGTIITREEAVEGRTVTIRLFKTLGTRTTPADQELKPQR